jgi:hypothetical protein
LYAGKLKEYSFLRGVCARWIEKGGGGRRRRRDEGGFANPLMSMCGMEKEKQQQ